MGRAYIAERGHHTTPSSANICRGGGGIFILWGQLKETRGPRYNMLIITFTSITSRMRDRRNSALQQQHLASAIPPFPLLSSKRWLPPATGKRFLPLLRISDGKNFPTKTLMRNEKATCGRDSFTIYDIPDGSASFLSL